MVVLRRRFHCFACERHFTEPDPACGYRRRLTRRLRERLAEACSHQTVKQVAQCYQVGPKTVRRAFAEYQDHLREVEPPPRRAAWASTISRSALELLAWRRMVADLPDAPEFSALDAMFAQWQEEILAYFTHRVTQGVVEGKNNRAKVIARQAYGYRAFPNFRRRLLCQSAHPPNRR